MQFPNMISASLDAEISLKLSDSRGRSADGEAEAENHTSDLNLWKGKRFQVDFKYERFNIQYWKSFMRDLEEQGVIHTNVKGQLISHNQWPINKPVIIWLSLACV